VITLEEYPHASPTFKVDITDEELETELEVWRVHQDEIDSLNKKEII